MNMSRIDGSEESLVVSDNRGNLVFASWDLASMLGYPVRWQLVDWLVGWLVGWLLGSLVCRLMGSKGSLVISDN